MKNLLKSKVKYLWLLSVPLFVLTVAGFINQKHGNLDTRLSQRLFFQKYVDELPDLQRIKVQPGQTDFTIVESEFQHQFHHDIPASTVWGYNGSYPGPLIEVEKDQAIRVHWQNQLPSKHIFALPKGGMGGNVPDVKTVTHLHGAVVQQATNGDKFHNNDGWPDDFIVNGEEQVSEYPNPQSARILWYHDHAIGDTGRNVAAGLSGVYFIHDEYERSLNLPSGDFEVPLFFQTQGFAADGTRFYTTDISQEFYANTVAINGKIWPFKSVEPRKYRFRMVNGSNARSYGLKLVDSQNQSDGPAFYQIASDGGFLETTAVLNNPTDPMAPRLTIAPGERADVVIDFSKFAGRSLILENNSVDPGDAEILVPQLMLFKVAAQVSAPDTSNLPMQMQSIVRMVPQQASKFRQIVFDQVNMADGTPMLQLNGKAWRDPVEEKPILGSTEVWELVDAVPDAHPFHIHLVNFQVLDRTPFDVEKYKATGQYVVTGASVPPAPNEMGWKDVVRVMPRMITRIIMQFGPYTGHYVYHCHILEHEDMDMMRPFDVVSGEGQ